MNDDTGWLESIDAGRWSLSLLNFLSTPEEVMARFDEIYHDEWGDCQCGDSKVLFARGFKHRRVS